MINVNHYECLDKIAKNGSPANGANRFYFQSTFPFRMVCIDFEFEGWHTILTEEHWPFDFLVFLLSLFNLKTEFNQRSCYYFKNVIAC